MASISGFEGSTAEPQSPTIVRLPEVPAGPERMPCGPLQQGSSNLLLLIDFLAPTSRSTSNRFYNRDSGRLRARE